MTGFRNESFDDPIVIACQDFYNNKYPMIQGFVKFDFKNHKKPILILRSLCNYDKNEDDLIKNLKQEIILEIGEQFIIDYNDDGNLFIFTSGIKNKIDGLRIPNFLIPILEK